MATEIQTGKAKIYGLGAADVVLGAATVVEQTMTGADLSFDAAISEIQNQNGDTETLISSNPTLTLTINFMPTAATRALAITEAEKYTALSHLAKVTTSDFDVDMFNGKWNLMGLQIRGANTETMTFVLNLKAWVAVVDGSGANGTRDKLTVAVTEV